VRKEQKKRVRLLADRGILKKQVTLSPVVLASVRKFLNRKELRENLKRRFAQSVRKLKELKEIHEVKEVKEKND
jgi:hypothetical protein